MSQVFTCPSNPYLFNTNCKKTVLDGTLQDLTGILRNKKRNESLLSKIST